MQANASPGFGVVGDLGAAVLVNGLVRLARGDHLDAARGEERAQADAEGEVGVLFELAAAEVASGVVASVGGGLFPNRVAFRR